MLMTAYACSIGGVLTPIGTPPNLIMMGFLETLAPGAPSISFFDWMIWGFVAMVGYFVIAYAVLWRMFPADVKRIEGAHEFIEKHRKALGKWNRAQVNTMIAFMAAVAMWVAPGILSMILGSKSEIVKAFTEYMPEELVAMIGGLMLFLLPVDIKQGKMTMTWRDGVEGIEWGTLLLFGGGLAMGSLMYTTGLSTWVGAGLRELMGGNPSELVFVTVFCVAGLLISELTSHTAATNLLAPIAISTALSMGMNPIPVAVGLALAASLGFMMPVSTPPNAIVYSSGYVPITKMIKSGAIIDVVGILFVTIPVIMILVKWVMGVS
jgi:sodium-dependent dicarboxylate transporter 2/3/5